MGKVIQMKKSGRQTSGPLAAVVRELLLKSETGGFTSLMYVASRPDRTIESGIVGGFTEDLDFAIASARDGFNCLLGHKTCVEPETSQLPRRLRKDYQDEKTCSVVACGSRR